MVEDREPIFVSVNAFGAIQTHEERPRPIFIRANAEGAFILVDNGDGADVIASFLTKDEAERAYDAAAESVTLGDVIATIKREEKRS